jgi:hypothetical protein
MSTNGINRDSVSTLAAQAATEPTRFNATERSAFLRTHIQQVKSMVQNGHAVIDINAVFPQFAEEYPSLLEMLTRPGGYDDKSLAIMVNMLDKMGAGRASQHEASIQVGQHLLNKYVKPQLE